MSCPAKVARGPEEEDPLFSRLCNEEFKGFLEQVFNSNYELDINTLD
jgi:hypothetical protein